MVRSRLCEACAGSARDHELLVRDWDAERDFDAVTERLDHLEWLGITAIELMPVSEFDGNTSWGYNPGPRFAVDKQYGTAQSLKRLSTRRTIADCGHFGCGAQPQLRTDPAQDVPGFRRGCLCGQPVVQ